MGHHVVIGSGALGRATALALAEEGLQAKIVSRRPAELLGIESLAVDATNPAALDRALAGAEVVYNCASAPYHRWTRELPPLWRGIQSSAIRAKARLVIASNLYAYGMPVEPFTSESSFSPCSEKGRVRAMLESEALDAHSRGEMQVAIVRGSDFYGPEVLMSQIGDRFFPRLIAGKTAGLVGRMDQPHSYTYLPDFAQTMVQVGIDADRSGRNWIVPSAPPVTGEQLATIVENALVAEGLSMPQPVIRPVSRGMLRMAGLFDAGARALVEMYYEFDRPFTVDATETATLLGQTPTGLSAGLRQTLAWYMDRSGVRAAVPAG